MQFLLLFLWLIFFCIDLYSQKPSLRQDSVRIDLQNKRIIIPYQLSDGSNFKYEYRIQLYYTQNGGATYIGPLRKTTGHVGFDVLAEGEQKQIVWNYAEEIPTFSGTNVRFKIKADFKPSVLNLKNAEATWYSVLVPGLGNPKVRYYKGWQWKHRWMVTSTVVYGLIGTGIWMNQNARDSYNAYSQSGSAREASEKFQKAAQQKTLSRVLILAGSSIWAADVVRVFIKGTSNKIEKKRILEKNKKMDIDLGIGGTTIAGQPSLGIKLKF